MTNSIAAMLAESWPEPQIAPDGNAYVPLVATHDGPCYGCGGTIHEGESYWFGQTWCCDSCRVREQAAAKKREG